MIKGFTREYTKEDFDKASMDELNDIIEDVGKEMTKHWTDEDRTLIDESMKNIADRPIWNAIYQARTWAFLEARATTVKMNTQKERKEYFDRQISSMEDLVKIVK